MRSESTETLSLIFQETAHEIFKWVTNDLKPKWGQCCTLRMFVVFIGNLLKVLYNRLTVAFSFSSLFLCGMRDSLRPQLSWQQGFPLSLSLLPITGGAVIEHSRGLRLSGRATHFLCYPVAREVSVDDQLLTVSALFHV